MSFILVSSSSTRGKVNDGFPALNNLRISIYVCTSFPPTENKGFVGDSKESINFVMKNSVILEISFCEVCRL